LTRRFQGQFPNPHQSERREHFRSSFDRTSGVLGGSANCVRWIRRLVSALHYLSRRRMPSLHEFLPELRSFVHRMELHRTRRYNLFGVDLGPSNLIAADGHLEGNTRTLACSADIESFLAGHPWATMVDSEVYRDAWVKGAEWALRTSCKRDKENSAA
jgi:hypothetical protein